MSVTALTNFACRQGDLAPEGVIGPSAKEGIKAHQRYQKNLLDECGEDVVLEVESTLACNCIISGRQIRLSGRVDWVNRATDQLGEIKTTLVPSEHVPESQKALQWAQLYLYGYIYHQHNLTDNADNADNADDSTIELKLVHINLTDGKNNVETRLVSTSELVSHALTALRAYIQWIVMVEHCRDRMVKSAGSLSFPFDQFRDGQRDMAAAVFRACRDAEYLMCEAPTGIGKTISALYPGIKSLAERSIDQIAYLTAKVAGRLSAMRALTQLQEQGLAINAIEIRAKQSSCFCANGQCQRDEQGRCPMTLGFYDRLPAARDELIQIGVISNDDFEHLAWNYQLCPFELTQQLLPWMHVIIADYNYVFDPLVRLAHFSVDNKQTALLVDESHNLLDRSRHMYSAELSSAQCQDMADACWQSHPLIASHLTRLISDLHKLADYSAEGERVQEGLDSLLPNQVSTIVSMLFEQLNKSNVLSSEAAVTLFRALCRFMVIADLYGDHHRSIIKSVGKGQHIDVKVHLVCLDASSALTAQYRSYRSVVLFSATMRPGVFYRDTLGLPAETKRIQLNSPFDSDSAYQAIVSWIDTRYHHRQASLPALIDLIKSTTSHKLGNYLVFFPSYAYLEQAHKLFSDRYAEIETWLQGRNQSKSEQRALLSHLQKPGHRLGFAIQGGVFGEGIDYVGDLLIGVIIVGTGLPGIDTRTELIAEHYQGMGHDGFDFAYRFPGFTRVLQTVGRLIRDEEDEGIVLLVDTRFRQSVYRQLYPPHWKLRWPEGTATLNDEIAEFWSKR